MARTLHLDRFDAVLVQAVIAGALSFAHLHDIADAAGQDGWKAWAYPISVDLLLVAAWRRIRTLHTAGEPTRSAWCWFGIALTASLGANVATAGLLDLEHVPAWLRILVAGWPALAFFGGTLLAHTVIATARETADELTVTSANQGEAPQPPADEAPALEPATPEEPEETVPALEPAAPAPVVPAALVEHARKVADAHHERTGTRIDTDTLRARLGVPAPLADAVHAQLT